MPTYLIERDIPGADRLSANELREIATKSSQVVASLGVPYALDQQLRGRRQGLLRARGAA